jgi:hypothetical protein
MSFFRRTKTRAQAVAEDAAARKWAAAQDAMWEATRKDRLPLRLALGLELPERRPTAAEKRHVERLADKVINRELRRLLDGEQVDTEMKGLLHEWIKQRERGRGRPSGIVKRMLVVDAVSLEYRKARAVDPKEKAILSQIEKETGLRITPAPRISHKAILGRVGDRVGLGMERMKQLAPSGNDAFRKAVKKAARELARQDKAKK